MIYLERKINLVSMLALLNSVAILSILCIGLALGTGNNLLLLLGLAIFTVGIVGVLVRYIMIRIRLKRKEEDLDAPPEQPRGYIPRIDARQNTMKNIIELNEEPKTKKRFL